MFEEADLKRTYIRVNLGSKWGNVSLADATDEQFGAWAALRVPSIVGDKSLPWGIAERVDFCRFVEAHQGELVKIIE